MRGEAEETAEGGESGGIWFGGFGGKFGQGESTAAHDEFEIGSAEAAGGGDLVAGVVAAGVDGDGEGIGLGIDAEGGDGTVVDAATGAGVEGVEGGAEGGAGGRTVEFARVAIEQVLAKGGAMDREEGRGCVLGGGCPGPAVGGGEEVPIGDVVAEVAWGFSGRCRPVQISW